jgi:hypothetical protein
MSAKLVKKLLQQTRALDAQDEETQEINMALQKKKRRKLAASQIKTIYDVDPIQKKVNAMLQFDRSISKYSTSGDRELQKTMKQHQKETKKRKLTAEVTSGHGVGNTRCSSSRNAQQKQERTFDKKRNAEKKKTNSLRNLARMLQKQNSKPIK